MKYSRLTKEQFEELHQEFANFLASQSITADEWKKIKTEKPHIAEDELDVFSDLIWEGVLKKIRFLENNSSKQLSLFEIKDNEMKLLVVKINNSSIDLSTKGGMLWLENNILSDEVELFTASKKFSEDKNNDVFLLIKQGAVLSDGKLFQAFQKILPKTG